MPSKGDKRYEVRWYWHGKQIGYPVMTPDIEHFCRTVSHEEGSIIQWRADGSHTWHDVLPN